MKTLHTSLPAPSRPDDHHPSGFPDAAELAVLPAWYAGVAVRPAVECYLPSALGDGKSARGVLGRIRRRLVAIARSAHRDHLAALLDHPAEEHAQHAKAVAQAIEALRTTRPPEPQIADDIAQWFAPRAVRVLQAYGITTLADLTVGIPRRRQWWKVVPGPRHGQRPDDRGVLGRVAGAHRKGACADRDQPAKSYRAVGIDLPASRGRWFRRQLPRTRRHLHAR